MTLDVFALLVVTWLDELGPTFDNVAESLEKLGIKGDRQSCSTCPIARYLIQKTASMQAFYHVAVMPKAVRIYSMKKAEELCDLEHGFYKNLDDLLELDRNHYEAMVPLPEQVQRFIDFFDQGELRNLEC